MIDLSYSRRIHILAAGGVGMSAIAQALLARGHQVSGSDCTRNRYTKRLESLGISIHAEENLSPVLSAELVVRSTAIRDDHPAWQAAQEKNISVCHRSEVLAEILNTAHGVALAGTHGKTTTTAMAGAVFADGGLDPTVLVGGWVDPWESNVRLGGSDWVVAEADESDGSFTRFEPAVAVVTNIEADHLDYFEDLEDIQAHFKRFANGLKPGGTIWVGHTLREFFQDSIGRDCELRSYGWCEDSESVPDIALSARRREGSRWCADLCTHDFGDTTLQLQVAGRFNLENAAAAVGCGLSAGVGIENAARALDEFQGTGRRQETISETAGITIIDDYAHHATEIAATLTALKEKYESRRLVALFQPHRYTRTRDHAEEIAEAFGAADAVRLLALYAASEDPIPGVSAQALAELISKHHSDVRYLGGIEDACAALLAELQSGDVLVTMGAGDVTTAGPKLAEVLARRRGEN